MDHRVDKLCVHSQLSAVFGEVLESCRNSANDAELGLRSWMSVSTCKPSQTSAQCNNVVITAGMLQTGSGPGKAGGQSTLNSRKAASTHMLPFCCANIQASFLLQ